MSIAKQFLLLKFSNEFVAISNQKNNKSSNVKNFEKFDKVKIYNINDNVENEIEKSFHNQNNVDVDDQDVDNYRVSKNISRYQFVSYNELENENNNVVYLITSKMFSFEYVKLIVCNRCDNNFSLNNKFHDHIRSICSRKSIFIYFTNISNKSIFTIMTIRDFNFIMITRNSTRKFLSINFDVIINSFSTAFNEFTNSSITSFEFITILSNMSKSFSDDISILLIKFKFTFVFIIVSDVELMFLKIFV